MIAKVIVDVTARETDRPFDYLIPERLGPRVQPGVRVGVPFGARTIKGFVIGVAEEAETAPDKLRPIQSVLDDTPVVTPELLELAKWMSRKYLCPFVTALTAVLPGVLKTKTETELVLAGGADGDAAMIADAAEQADVRDVVAFVKRKGRVTESQLLAAFGERYDAVKLALAYGLLMERKHVKDATGTKRQLFVVPAAEAHALLKAAEAAEKRAPKQAELLRSLAEAEAEKPLAELLRELRVGASAVKALEAKGWLRLNEKEVLRDPYGSRRFTASEPLPLTAAQARVLAPIRSAIRDSRYVPFLLHGVTGSGKTEVYLQAMQACLDAGREAILLVPEISLTPQTVSAFKGRFGDEVAVIHSRLSQGERYDEWRRMANKQVRIGIGARSAIFAPFTNIGLIIVDEEHESSYKQGDPPKYHARDVALERGAKHGSAVVLGSATPSLETYLAARQGTYELLEMPERVEGRPLPRVDIIDMRQELRSGNRAMFSGALQSAIAGRLERGEQTVLLLNRRGYATFVLCRSCGYTAQCPHCDIALTYHRSSRHSRCHYCGYTEREVERCPSCDSEHIRHFGVGTQRVEEELAKLFPGIRTIRMDVDTTSGKGAHEKLLAAFRERKADVLLGTQMVAKGLDFPFVTLVGVISADTTLRLPDFRSAERTFQLLTQVAGRSGRHALPGEVIVQTYTPDHYSIEFASRHDYIGFARRELTARKELGYPPYRKLASVTLSHEDVARLFRVSESFAADLSRRLPRASETAEAPELLGPVPSPIPKLKDRYRFQCVVKYRGETEVAEALRSATDAFLDEIRKTKLSIQLDVDPQVLI